MSRGLTTLRTEAVGASTVLESSLWWAGSTEGALRRTGGKLGPVTAKEAQSSPKEEGDSVKAEHWWGKQEQSHLSKNSRMLPET